MTEDAYAAAVESDVSSDSSGYTATGFFAVLDRLAGSAANVATAFGLAPNASQQEVERQRQLQASNAKATQSGTILKLALVAVVVLGIGAVFWFATRK